MTEGINILDENISSSSFKLLQNKHAWEKMTPTVSKVAQMVIPFILQVTAVWHYVYYSTSETHHAYVIGIVSSLFWNW